MIVQKNLSLKELFKSQGRLRYGIRLLSVCRTIEIDLRQMFGKERNATSHTAQKRGDVGMRRADVVAGLRHKKKGETFASPFACFKNA